MITGEMLKLRPLYTTVLNLQDIMDFRIGCFCIESLRRDEWCIVTTFTKQRVGGLLRHPRTRLRDICVTVFGGFPVGLIGMFPFRAVFDGDPSLYFSPAGRR